MCFLLVLKFNTYIVFILDLKTFLKFFMTFLLILKHFFKAFSRTFLGHLSHFYGI